MAAVFAEHDRDTIPDPVLPRPISGINELAGPRPIDSGVNALTQTAAVALVRAAQSKRAVRVVTRGDIAAGMPVRVIEGVPMLFSLSRDGREQVRIAVSEDSEQVILIERISAVLPLWLPDGE